MMDFTRNLGRSAIVPGTNSTTMLNGTGRLGRNLIVKTRMRYTKSSERCNANVRRSAA